MGLYFVIKGFCRFYNLPNFGFSALLLDRPDLVGVQMQSRKDVDRVEFKETSPDWPSSKIQLTIMSIAILVLLELAKIAIWSPGFIHATWMQMLSMLNNSKIMLSILLKSHQSNLLVCHIMPGIVSAPLERSCFVLTCYVLTFHITSIT